MKRSSADPARIHVLRPLGLMLVCMWSGLASAQESGVLYTPAPAAPKPYVYTPQAAESGPAAQVSAAQVDTAQPSTAQAANANAAPDGVAGWYPDEGFAIKSRDGQFKLRVGLQAGYRIQPYWRDGKSQDRSSFFVLRPFIEGHIFRDWVRFWTSFEFSVYPGYLLDSFVEIMPYKQFGLRIGQQWTPLSRHEYSGPHQLLFPDWAPVANFFWTGRDKGITALGSLLDGKIDYYAGIYAGSPLRQFTTPSGTWMTTARLTFNPMGPVATHEVPYITSEKPIPRRVSFTLQGAAGDYATTTANFNPSTFSIAVVDEGIRSKRQIGGIDLWLQGPRFAFLAEAYMRRTDATDANAYSSTGFWGQIGYMVWDRTMDVGLRANWLNASNKATNDRGYTLEGQVGYYPFHTLNLVTRLRYGYGKQENPREGALGTGALLIPPGSNHLLTLQLMLAI